MNAVRRKESEVAALKQSLYMLEGVGAQKATKYIRAKKIKNKKQRNQKETIKARRKRKVLLNVERMVYLAPHKGLWLKNTTK